VSNRELQKKMKTCFTTRQRKKCSQSNSYYGKINGIDRYLQHICATCYRKEGKKMFIWLLSNEDREICKNLANFIASCLSRRDLSDK
jgi:hypothetical protein